jgi:hypothetical protein
VSIKTQTLRAAHYLIQEAGGFNYTPLHQDGERQRFPIAFWEAHSLDSRQFHFTSYLLAIQALISSSVGQCSVNA